MFTSADTLASLVAATVTRPRARSRAPPRLRPRMLYLLAREKSRPAGGRGNTPSQSNAHATWNSRAERNGATAGQRLSGTAPGGTRGRNAPDRVRFARPG